MGAAADLYAEVATNYNQLHNASVWITSQDKKYQKILTKFLDDIGIEERIYDWGCTTGAYGDLLVEVNGEPGLGVISVDDSAHPANLSRTDYGGVLLGFYRTPFESGGFQMSAGECELLPPWKFVHFRLLGVKKKRPVYADPTYQEYRTIYLMGAETKQVSSKYGSSLLFNGLPVYKRLRLAEDSIQLARLTRGILRYIYKVKCNGSTAEASAEILKEYMNTLKQARAIDTGDTTTKYDSKANPMCLRGEVKIRLCSGVNVTIKELFEDRDKYLGKHVWSVNPNTFQVEASQIEDIQKTRLDAQLVRVWIDSVRRPKYVDCTPDHQFMLRDGSFKEAQNLQPKDSLMPFYHKLSNKGLTGYECIYNPSENRYQFAHKLAVGSVVHRGYLVHHKNFNKTDNEPDNLFKISKLMHNLIHNFPSSEEDRKKISANQVAWLKGSKGNAKELYPSFAAGVESAKIKRNAYFATEEGQKARLEGNKKKVGRLTGERETRTCKCGCGEQFIIRKKVDKEFVNHSHFATWKKGQPAPKIIPYVTRICKCGCSEFFSVRITSDKMYKNSEHYWNHMSGGKRWGKQETGTDGKILNHKVIKVEWLSEREDTYDIQVEKNHNFALSVGIFVHNSVMEDLFIPVFNDAGDVTIEKIGGETDIRWIVDIEDLHNQLSCALRVPLPLLGGYTKDATGALGSEAIGKLGIRFARSARRLQRALCVGIERLCQIHLAYMGMDPDPKLFQVQMAETSTEEEEELRDSLDKSTDAIMKFMDMIDKAGRFDKVELLNYFNTKMLKLSDLDMKKYLLPGGANVPGEEVKEKVEEAVEEVRSRRALATDLYAALPIEKKNGTGTFQLKEHWDTEYGVRKVKIVNSKVVKTKKETPKTDEPEKKEVF
jgi:hypothetical protein